MLLYGVGQQTRHANQTTITITSTHGKARLQKSSSGRIKTQLLPSSPETAAMLFWALLASGQIAMRKVDGWQPLATKTN